MIPLQTQQITEKDSGTKGMHCIHYICSMDPSSPNHFKLSSLVVGSIISLGKGLFSYQLESCFTAGPHKWLEYCFIDGPHVQWGFMNWINLIIMKDQQIHFNFIGVFLLFYGHQRVSATYVAFFRVSDLRTLLFSSTRVVIMFLMYWLALPNLASPLTRRNSPIVGQDLIV
jgi:hypothetical protein